MHSSNDLVLAGDRRAVDGALTEEAEGEHAPRRVVDGYEQGKLRHGRGLEGVQKQELAEEPTGWVSGREKSRRGRCTTHCVQTKNFRCRQSMASSAG